MEEDLIMFMKEDIVKFKSISAAKRLKEIVAAYEKDLDSSNEYYEEIVWKYLR
jgi:hypothetical protein